MHAESGYFRPRPDGSIEVVIAQSTGLVEVQVNIIQISIRSVFTISFQNHYLCFAESLITERNIQCR